MKRKIYNKIKDWKTQWNGRTALLVDGARRIGKSWIVEEFARNEYKSFLLTLIMFRKVSLNYSTNTLPTSTLFSCN